MTHARLTRQRPAAAAVGDVLLVDPVASGVDDGRRAGQVELVEDQLKRAQVTRFEQMERERTVDRGSESAITTEGVRAR
jgi:hypothetical protein